MNLNKDTLPKDVIQPLKSDAPLIIYIDLKSPYAYLSIEPTRNMLKELGVVADWRPFVLDIPSYLGSAKLGKGGKKVTKQNRTEEQWSDVKYAYFDCRRYANLSEKTIRGTVKIWNTNLSAIGMLWLKSFYDLTEQSVQGSMLEQYIDAIFEPFWKRELDVEDSSVILRVLEQIKGPTDGFLEYAQGEGATLNDQLQESAFDQGIFGVPTFILPNESVYDPQHEKFFGREHLPRISWLLGGRQGPAPDVAYQLTTEVDDTVLVKSALDARSAPEPMTTPRQLTTFFDFKSPQSYLALKAILALKDEGISIDWRPFISKPMKKPAEKMAVEDRSTMHRRIRGEYLANDIQRYSPVVLSLKGPVFGPVKNIYREIECKFGDMGLIWLQSQLKANNDIIDDYVESVFEHLWELDGSIESANDIVKLLLALKTRHPKFFVKSRSILIKGWQEYVQGLGLIHLKETREEAKLKSFNMAPTFLLGSEPFRGQAQLPLIKARLKAGI